jgi:RNA polymerase sigma-70 factor, ECF subfamily
MVASTTARAGDADAASPDAMLGAGSPLTLALSHFLTSVHLMDGGMSMTNGTNVRTGDGVEKSDLDVIEQILRGDTALFELLMRRYNERVYRAARSILRDDHEAEDVMQQAYVNAFTHLRQFNGSARFPTWLTRIAINEALARVRRRGRYETFNDELPNRDPLVPQNPSENPERHAFAGELRRLLEWAIDALPTGMREVFVLRDVEGLSTAEAAECLDVSEEVVKTRLSRGRAALRALLMERTGATTPDAFRFYRPRCDRLVARVLAQIDRQPLQRV